MIEDHEFTTETIAKVDESDKSYELTYESGWSFSCPKRNGIVPHVGDISKQWGRGIGFSVRGLAINDSLVYYETASDFDARQKREREEKSNSDKLEYDTKLKAEHESRIQKLPLEFQSRIGGFRLQHPDWGWRFEGYELFACEEAFNIADKFKTVEAIRAFHSAPYERQREMLSELSDAHSGNTFGSACSLASLYISHPELIDKQHGALCPLVGCEDYGCFAVREQASHGVLGWQGRNPV